MRDLLMNIASIPVLLHFSALARSLRFGSDSSTFGSVDARWRMRLPSFSTISRVARLGTTLPVLLSSTFKRRWI